LFTTSDGINFKLSKPGFGGVASQYHILTSLDSLHFYVFAERQGTWSSNDGGYTWSRYNNVKGGLAGKMFSTREGAQFYSTNNLGGLRFDHDSLRKFADAKPEFDAGAEYLDALIVDSLETFALLRTTQYPLLLHTTSAGSDWSYNYPMGITDTRRNDAFMLVQGATPDRLFIMGGYRDASDYLQSTDRGRTWREVNVTNQRVSRLAEPEPGVLWLMVSRKPRVTDYDLYFEIYLKKFIDTLYYSKDKGQTWQKELRFTSDSLLAMSWPDARHGYVLSQHDSTLYLNTFIGSRENGVARKEENSTLEVYPNPAQDILHLRSSEKEGNTGVTIVDVLGRIVYRGDEQAWSGGSTDIWLPKNLPTGSYLLVIGDPVHRVTRAFLKH
jgi:hypothetical protein